MKLWKRVLLAVLAVVSGFLMALGFNTLDWLVHTEHYGTPPSTWCFVFPNKVCMPFWNAYFFGGILPLSLGSICIGIIVGALIGRRTRKTV